MTQAAQARARRVEIEAKAADRLIFFSDAVIAIAMTLLALELPLPAGATNADMLHNLNDNFGDYLAFIISFAVITLHWFGHHQIFRFVIAVPTAVMRWNMLWLLMIVLTPFATRVLADDDAFEFRFILYASVQALAGLLFALLVRSLERARVFDPVAPADVAGQAYQRLWGGVAMFGLSIPVALLFGAWAYGCWMAIPLANVLIRRVRSRRGASARSA